MTWSYAYDANSLNQPLYNVRLRIGDTQASRPLLQDEEILGFIGMRGSLYGACAEACRSLSNRFATSVDQKARQSQTWFSQMSKAYAAAAARFETLVSSAGAATPFVGGASDGDLGPGVPQLWIGIFDNPFADQPEPFDLPVPPPTPTNP